MPLGPIFDAEKKNLLAPPPKKSASNFCDLFQFTLSLIFTRPAANWPFLASPDALEVIVVSYSLTHLLSDH